ncbi:MULTISPECIES: hypothetical protein [Xenorhabdus]|uniref:hypothetical protein n=1 Tax=Xenorhabdus TaxID=626 RepID=UPI00064B549B|nr:MULTISPECIES: hypothetical protein [Xenorhabdus]KLU15427.1 hypothetical protein AAY47_10915 [Xenorhabdus griffiniae]KOP35155.1 hypothetical protein AFK69_00655 [Xenorhabdus sp. GDc328]
MITQTGTLLYGIEHADSVHHEFQIRLPTMRQSYAALDETESVCGTIDGHAADLHYRMAVVARCLVTLGTIPVSDITTELLLDQLTSEDFEVLEQAIAAVKKKRQPPPNAAAE